MNPVPVSVCRALGARYVIAVNLNADMCGRGTVVPYIEAGSQDALLVEVNGVPKKNGRSAMKLLQRQFFGPNETAPGISTVVMDAFNIVQDRIARSRLAGDPPDFMISPRLAGIGPFDFHRAAELIERGTAAAHREVEDIAREIEVRRMFEPRLEEEREGAVVEAGQE